MNWCASGNFFENIALLDEAVSLKSALKIKRGNVSKYFDQIFACI